MQGKTKGRVNFARPSKLWRAMALRRFDRNLRIGTVIDQGAQQCFACDTPNDASTADELPEAF